MMPKIAKGDANKVWILPSEFTKALEGLGSSIHEIAGIPAKTDGPLKRVDAPTIEPPTAPDSTAVPGTRRGAEGDPRRRGVRRVGRGPARRAAQAPGPPSDGSRRAARRRASGDLT